MTLYSKITGTGSYLPANRVTNEALATRLAAQGVETSHEWSELQHLHDEVRAAIGSALAAQGTHGFELLRKPYSVTDLSRILRRAVERAKSARR